MNFQDSKEQAIFRSRVQRWLKENAGDFLVTPEMPEKQAHDLGRAWQARKATEGYTGFTLPQAFGGRGGNMLDQMIFQAEEGTYALPLFNSFVESWGVALPVIGAFGTPEQYADLGPATLRGDVVWCQLFSEPSGGSDAAAIRTRAVRDGDEWVINGQKVWTSDAHLSDWGILLARTNPEVAKHKGLTMFLLDMRSPGVEVRPIRKINGDSEFNEVFFTDVRIADRWRVGEVDGGWKVCHATFNEENSAFSGAPSVIRDVFEPLLSLSASVKDGDGRPMLENALVRATIADYYVTCSSVKYTRYRQYTSVAKGGRLGFEGAISKLVLARLMEQIGAFGMDMVGLAGLLDDEAASAELAEFQQAFLVGPGLRIGGGTDEILLNNIAERVLGLPAGPRADKDVAFKDLPSSASSRT